MYSKKGLYIASLKHTKAIQFLLSSGASAIRHPILIKYRVSKKRHPSHPDIVFTPIISAKKIRKATDRNLLKRRIRAAARNSLTDLPQNHDFFSISQSQIQILYIYLDKEIKDFSVIEKATSFLNKKYISDLPDKYPI